MKHFSTCLILVALLCLAALAQAAPPAGFAANFVQTRTLPGFAQPLVSHGQLRFSTAQGFSWVINEPYHYAFTLKGDTAREVLPDGTQRTLDPAKTPWLRAVERIFVSALAGDEAQLQRYFTVKTTPAKAGRHVELTPKDAAMAKVITRIDVTESAPGKPRHLVIDEASGGRMDIRFTPLAGSGSK